MDFILPRPPNATANSKVRQNTKRVVLPNIGSTTLLVSTYFLLICYFLTSRSFPQQQISVTKTKLFGTLKSMLLHCRSPPPCLEPDLHNQTRRTSLCYSRKPIPCGQRAQRALRGTMYHSTTARKCRTHN